MAQRAAWLVLLATIAAAACAPRDEPARPAGSTDEKIDIAPPPVPASFKDRIDAAINHVRQRDLLTTHAFWTVFHGILGMGPEQTMLLDTLTNKRERAIDLISRGTFIR